MMNQKSKGKPIKKLFAMLMAFAMMITLLPGQSISVLAAEEENTPKTYTLTYDYSDGRPVKKVSGLTKIPDKLETPTKEGYIFEKWSDNTNYMYNTLEEGADLKYDTTIYAVWKKVAEDGITYRLNYGGNSYELVSVPDDYDEAKLKNFVVPDTVDNIPVTIVGMGSFSAVIGKIENLVFGNNVEKIEEISSGSLSVKSITIPDSVTILSSFVFKDFKGIKEVTLPAGIRGIYYKAFNGCTSLETVRIEGVLTEIGDGAFANCPNLKKIYYGGTKAQWDNEFHHDNDHYNGYCYHSMEIKDGWNSGSDSSVVEYENKYFVVNFDKNYKDQYPDNMPHYMVVKNGSLINEPSAPILYSHNVFEGWYKDAECTQKWDFSTDIVTDDTTLYANWESAERTVTFNYSGKSADSTETVVKGRRIAEPTEPDVEGYEIEGWYKDSAYTQKWNFATDTITEDMTLYAKWVERDSEVQGKSFKRFKIGDVLHAGDVIYFPAIPQEEQDKGITCNKFELLYYSTDPEKPNYYIHHGTDWVYKDQSEYQMPQKNDGSAFSFEIKEIVCNGRVYKTFKIEEKSIRSGLGGTKNYIYDMAVRPMEGDAYDYETPALEYTINATASEGGSISPSGSIKVTEGQNQTFTMTPEEGYEIDTVKVDGTTVTASSSYTFTDVKENHTIEVTFKKQIHKIDTVEIRGIDAPAAGRELETTAVCNTEGISTKTPIVRWTPDVTIAGYNSSYTASVTISASEKFVFADNVTATVNGKTATGVTKNQDGTITVTYTFDATEKDKLISITAPQAITVANGTRYENMKLPKTVQIVTEGKTVTVADVIWDTSADNNYDPSKLTEQIVKLNGTVTCPDTIDSNQVPLTTSITVTVSAAGIIPEVPKITSQPENATIQEGETATFTVTAAGIDLTYQWRIDRNDGKGFVAIEAANQAFYTTSVADKSCNGFQYQCVVSNSAGTVTSDTAVLTVNEKKTQQSDDSEIQWQLLNRAKEITEKTLAEFQAKNGTKQADLADLVAQALKDNHIYSVISAVTAFQKTEPTEKAEGKINGIVTLSIGSYSAEVSFDYALAKTEQTNTTQKTEKIAGSGAQTSNGQVKISWNAMSEADGYQIYVSLCNGKNSYKMLKDTKTLNGTIKNLDNTKSYKFYVVAYKNVDGKKVRISKSMVYHVTLADGKYTNVKAIKVPKSTYTLDIGEKKKLTARSVKEDKTKKLLKHAQEFRYYSSDASIAVVSKNGEIKAKKPGSCIIYIVANNGVVKKVKVTVS